MKLSHVSLVVLALLLLGAGPATKPAPRPPLVLAAQPGDRLRIAIFEWVTPGLPWEAELTVDASGCLTIPNLGRVSVEGLTPAEIQIKIGKNISNIGMLGGTHSGPEVKVQFANFI